MLKTILLYIFGKGNSDLGLRKQIYETVKKIVNTNSYEPLSSNNLNKYIDKVARNAYKIIDEDIEALKSLGFTEDEIFELTIVAAFSAGETRVKLATNLLS